MSTLDEGLDELVEDLKWARAEEDGEVEWEEPLAPGSVFMTDDEGTLTLVGTADEVQDHIAEVFERGYAGLDFEDDTDDE